MLIAFFAAAQLLVSGQGQTPPPPFLRDRDRNRCDRVSKNALQDRREPVRMSRTTRPVPGRHGSVPDGEVRVPDDKVRSAANFAHLQVSAIARRYAASSPRTNPSA